MSGRRSFGSVRQRTNGKWEARYHDVRGEVFYRYFTTKAEADGHLAMVKADMLRGDWLDPRLGQITVREWSVKFMETKRKIRPTTRDLYDYLLRLHILTEFGDWQLSHITTADVEAWMTKLHNNPKLAPSTEKKALRLFTAMMTLAVRHRRLHFNPCEPVESPEEKVAEMLFLTEAQVADLAEAMGTFREPWRALVLLAGYGGLRWGECVGLPVRHVDPLRSRVRVAQQLHKDGRIDEPKTTSSVRTVNLPKWLSEELATACALRSPADGLSAEHSELVFFTTEGTPLAHGSTFNRRWWRQAVVTALPTHLHGLRFHDLRHTAVAIALHSSSKAGHPLNPKQLQERMGHSTIRMTLDRYGHLFEGHDDKMVEAMTNPFTDREPRHLRAV